MPAPPIPAQRHHIPVAQLVLLGSVLWNPSLRTPLTRVTPGGREFSPILNKTKGQMLSISKGSLNFPFPKPCKWHFRWNPSEDCTSSAACPLLLSTKRTSLGANLGNFPCPQQYNHRRPCSSTSSGKNQGLRCYVVFAWRCAVAKTSLLVHFVFWFSSGRRPAQFIIPVSGD